MEVQHVSIFSEGRDKPVLETGKAGAGKMGHSWSESRLS